MNKYHLLHFLSLIVALTIITSSCNKEKITSGRMEGKWVATKFEYPDNYVADFESTPNDYMIELWNSVKLSFGSVNDDGIGKISATGSCQIKNWYGTPQEITALEMPMSNIFYDNYSISEDGKTLQYLNSTNVVEREDQIVRSSKKELVLVHKMRYGNNYIKVTYAKSN